MMNLFYILITFIVLSCGTKNKSKEMFSIIDFALKAKKNIDEEMIRHVIPLVIDGVPGAHGRPGAHGDEKKKDGGDKKKKKKIEDKTKIEMAKKMKKDGMATYLIMKYTGLSRDEVNKL